MVTNSNDANYQPWLWSAGDSAWIQPPAFHSLRFGEGYNASPYMSMSVIDADLTYTTKGLFKAGIPWRVTGIDSTNGANGTFICEGILSQPSNDAKSTDFSGNPIYWNLTGVGYEDRLNNMAYDPAQVTHAIPGSTATYMAVPALSGPYSGIIDSLINDINTRHGSTVVHRAFSDDNSGTNPVTDSSGNARNGSPRGSPIPSLVVSPFAGFANAYSFDGVQNYVSVPAAGMGVSGAFCIEAKVNRGRHGLAINEAVAAKFLAPLAAGSGNYLLYFQGTGAASVVTAEIVDNFGAVQAITGTIDVPVGTHDVAMSYDGATLRVFIDGTLDGSLAITGLQAPDSTTPFTIGARSHQTLIATDFFQGSVDEVRLSNIARHTANYAPAAAPFVTDANTLALYHLDTLVAPPNHSVKFRQDQLYQCLLDLAYIGDATSQFPYRVMVRSSDKAIPASTGDFSPAIVFLSPIDSQYTMDNGTIGFRTQNPVTGAALHQGTGAGTIGDATRIIDDSTNATNIIFISENDRIRNAVDVKYSGQGTGLSAAGTQSAGYSTNTGSIAAFKRREDNLYAPWAQDAATAIRYRDTYLNTFKGYDSYLGSTDTTANASGIQRCVAILQTGKLYDSGVFTATIGDTVAIRKSGVGGTVILTGKMLAFDYSQDTGQLTVTVGLLTESGVERAGMAGGAGSDAIMSSVRDVRANYNASELVNFLGVASPNTAPVRVADVTLDIKNKNVGAIADFTTSAVSRSGQLTGVYAEIQFSTSTSCGGPVLLNLQMATTGGPVNLGNMTVWSVIPGDYTFDVFYPFSVIAGTITSVSFVIQNQGAVNNFKTNANSGTANKVSVTFLSTNIDISHAHQF